MFAGSVVDKGPLFEEPEIGDSKTGVVSMRVPIIDMAGPFGDLIVSQLAVFANLESQFISERKAQCQDAPAQQEYREEASMRYGPPLWR